MIPVNGVVLEHIFHWLWHMRLPPLLLGQMFCPGLWHAGYLPVTGSDRNCLSVYSQHTILSEWDLQSGVQDSPCDCVTVELLLKPNWCGLHCAWIDAAGMCQPCFQHKNICVQELWMKLRRAEKKPILKFCFGCSCCLFICKSSLMFPLFHLPVHLRACTWLSACVCVRMFWQFWLCHLHSCTFITLCAIFLNTCQSSAHLLVIRVPVFPVLFLPVLCSHYLTSAPV